jgi:glyoxylase-like metal-dependent hydrolase (beta-lactamase superfamily II)
MPGGADDPVHPDPGPRPGPRAARPSGDAVPKVHRYQATLGDFFTNAWLVETAASVVAVDATLAIPSTDELRARLDAIGKPLAAVLLTHGHPDHYTGIGELVRGRGGIPILATAGAIAQCQARDEEESGYLGSDQAFGAAYPKHRVFPDQVVDEGQVVTFDDVSFTVRRLGPAESDDDTLWVTDLGGIRTVFSGDIVYHGMHAFFRDGHTREWLAVLDTCLREFDERTVFHGGHGDSYGIEQLHWQRGYLTCFVDLLERTLAGRRTLPPPEQQRLLARMKNYLPTDDLIMLTGWQFDDMVTALRADGVLSPEGKDLQ